jgi:hypothetical protein
MVAMSVAGASVQEEDRVARDLQDEIARPAATGS